MTEKRDRLSVEISQYLADVLDELVEVGIYRNRSEAIRDFIRRAQPMIGEGKFNNAHDLAKASAGNNPKVKINE